MTRVVICAENSVTRAGLAAIATLPSTQIIDQVSSLPTLMTWLQTQTVDLAIVELPILTQTIVSDLLQLTIEWPLAESVSMLLLVDVWGIDAASPGTLLQLISTGRISMLPLTTAADALRDAIATLSTGLVVLHPEITEALSGFATGSSIPTDGLPEPLLESLTPREIEVLNQLAAGLSNKAIASTLAISEHTVKFHISAILSKLGVSSRTEAVTVGIRAGLVML
ncbi:MAG: response regulator transcription factor [Cyanobacteria bacterium J06626_18]